MFGASFLINHDYAMRNARLGFDNQNLRIHISVYLFDMFFQSAIYRLCGLDIHGKSTIIPLIIAKN